MFAPFGVEESGLWVLSTGAGPPTRLGSLTGESLHPDWSPDGRYLAVEYAGAIWITGHIWIIRVADGTALQATLGTASESDPAWAPDGAGIAYCTQGDIWFLGRGASTPRQVTSDPANDCEPTW